MKRPAVMENGGSINAGMTHAANGASRVQDLYAMSALPLQPDGSSSEAPMG
jgi:hypothetical protein